MTREYMKRFLILSAIFLSIAFISCDSRTWVCECGDGSSGFEEKGRYDDEKEAQSGCYTIEVQLKLQNTAINCLVREL